MAESLRFLILEDSPADAELMQFELHEAGFLFDSKVVETERDFVRELQEFSASLILSDYDLPKYSGALALAEAKKRCPDTPFILVTGAVTEDRAIDILTQGAKDYVLKSRLQQRLAPAVQRALAEAKEQRARKKAEEELREAHRNLEDQVAERTADLRREVEHRRQIEQSLLRYTERLELLSYTASRLLASDKPQQIVEELCLKVMEFLDCDAFFNFLVDEAAGRLHLNACAGIPKETARTIEWLDYGIAICGCAARDACRLVAENIPETPDVRTELVKSFGIKAYACHPLMEQNRVLGTLSFGTRSRTTFSTDDLAMMKAVADQVAIAMGRVRTENALRESESLLRAFFDSPGLPRGIVEVVDGNIRFVSGNKVAAAAYGLTPETMHGKFVSELDIPTELMQVYLEGCKEALQKSLVSFEVFHQLPDTGRWFLVTGSYLGVHPTGFPRFAFVMLDITERRKAEESLQKALAESERDRAFLEAIISAQSDIVIMYDTQRNVQRVNPAFMEVHGFDPMGLHVTEVMRRVACRSLDGRPLALEEQPTPRALAGKKVTGLTFAVTRADGSDGMVEVSSGPIRQGNLIIGAVTVWHDITEQKKNEGMLRESEERFRVAFDKKS
ncbi:MAG: PAS domain S-box protein [Deltaproteobacteria bacterium]|nr:PAS domain S-box protein [Deltaproteobacteria bacterium]